MIISLIASFPDVISMLPLVDIVALGASLLAIGFFGGLLREEHI